MSAPDDARRVAAWSRDDALRESVKTLRDGYASQMKFCDIEPLPYFREFVRRLDAILKAHAEDVRLTSEDAELIDRFEAALKIAIYPDQLSGVRCPHGWDTHVCPMRGCGPDLEAAQKELVDAAPRLIALARLASTPAPGGDAMVEALRSALTDLLSWFPEKPSDPEWRIKGGEQGANDAVAAARAALDGMSEK